MPLKYITKLFFIYSRYTSFLNAVDSVDKFHLFILKSIHFVQHVRNKDVFSYLIAKVDKMFELIEEIVNKTNYTDKERLKAVLTRHQSRLDSRVKRDGWGFARTRMQSYYSNQGKFNELRNGLDYYWFITDLVDNFDEKSDVIISNLSKIVSQLFTKENLIVGSTCAKSDFDNYLKHGKGFINSLPSQKSDIQKWGFTPEKKNEGLLSASKVQYVLQGYDMNKLGYEWNGKMRVLRQILSREFITNQVRVIGGAYGGYAIFLPTGHAYFGSYRDPNLGKTFENTFTTH